MRRPNEDEQFLEIHFILVFLSPYCKFLIKGKELIFVKIREKQSLRILIHGSYFSDSFGLYMKSLQKIGALDFIFPRFDAKRQNCRIKILCKIRNLQYIFYC